MCIGSDLGIAPKWAIYNVADGDGAVRYPSFILYWAEVASEDEVKRRQRFPFDFFNLTQVFIAFNSISFDG